MLFEGFDRISQERKLHNESLFDFYNKSAKLEMGQARDNLNQLFKDYKKYAEESKVLELTSRIKSKDNHQFGSAFFELFLHGFYRKNNCGVKIAPKLGKSEPDFFVSENSGLEYYVEASVITEKTRTDFFPGDEIADYIRDNLSRVINNGFTPIIKCEYDQNPFWPKLNSYTDQKKAYQSIKEWILNLDRKEVRSIIEANNFQIECRKEISFYDNKNCKWLIISVLAWPMSDEIAQKNQFLHFNSGTRGFAPKIDLGDIYKKIEQKIKQHDRENIIIALHIPEFYTMNNTIILADLYGINRIIDHEKRIVDLSITKCSEDSVFIRKDGTIRNRNVTGIILFNNIYPQNTSIFEATYFPHPFNEKKSEIKFTKTYHREGNIVNCHAV